MAEEDWGGSGHRRTGLFAAAPLPTARNSPDMAVSALEVTCLGSRKTPREGASEDELTPVPWQQREFEDVWLRL